MLSFLLACAAPLPGSTGYVPRTGYVWMGRKWDMNNGLSWNHNTPYAVCLGTDYARFELHDTTYDHGQSDPSTKRRDEIGVPKVFQNGVEYWVARSFKAHVNNLRSGLAIREHQIHWPSGASPAIGSTIVSFNGGIGYRVTTKNDNTGNVTCGTVPLTQDQWHDVVERFKLGSSTASSVDIWLDGKLVCHKVGFIGSLTQNGYGYRIGSYAGSPLNGMSTVVEYTNLSPFPSSVSLESRITNPPVMP